MEDLAYIGVRLECLHGEEDRSRSLSRREPALEVDIPTAHKIAGKWGGLLAVESYTPPLHGKTLEGMAAWPGTMVLGKCEGQETSGEGVYCFQGTFYPDDTLSTICKEIC